MKLTRSRGPTARDPKGAPAAPPPRPGLRLPLQKMRLVPSKSLSPYGLHATSALRVMAWEYREALREVRRELRRRGVV